MRKLLRNLVLHRLLGLHDWKLVRTFGKVSAGQRSIWFECDCGARKDCQVLPSYPEWLESEKKRMAEGAASREG